jgi:hypothetical protein
MARVYANFLDLTDDVMNPGSRTPNNNTGGGNTGGGTGGDTTPRLPINYRKPKTPKPEPDPNNPDPFSWAWLEKRNQAARQSALDTLRQGMSGITAGLDEFTADYIRMLSEMEARQAEELGTQVGEGRQTIDEATQRAMQTLSQQGNPYANLQMATMPEVVNPLASYMQNSGASAQAVNQLSQMLNQGNVGAGAAFQNLAQILGASGQASAASRMADVDLARAASMRDLEANRRALTYQISTGRNMAEMDQRRAANEAARAAALQGLQQELAIGQSFDQQDSQLMLTLLQLLGQSGAGNASREIRGLLGLSSN